MKFSGFLAPLTLASTALAQWKQQDNSCLTDAEAQYLIDQAIIVLKHVDIANARAVAYSIFAPDIVEYGDSINSLRGAPLGTLVEPDRETYVNNTLAAPAIPEIVTLAIVHDCANIVWQWSFYGAGNGQNERINGFTLAKVNSDKLIDYQYIEFNSLAWAENSNFTITPPTTGPFAPDGGSKVRRSTRS